jgi:NTE family protein
MKRALVVSGGGGKGAYSVGVVKALLESGRKYDVIAGVSVGALIGAHLSMFKPEEQWTNFSGLEDVWTKDVKGTHSIYKNWAPGFLTYLWSLWKSGLYDMSPLRDILVKRVDLQKLQNSGVEFEVGVVSLQSGEYKSINLSSDLTSNQKAVDWIWASCVFPVLFPPVEINGEQWVDGGARDVIPIKDVIKYNVTHIDAILTSPRTGYMTGVEISNEMLKTSLDVGLRCANLLSDEIYTDDINNTCLSNNITLEIFDPKCEVNKDSFKFDPIEIRTLINQGHFETKERLNKK